jgi:uncharacterized protein YPO0396
MIFSELLKAHPEKEQIRNFKTLCIGVSHSLRQAATASETTAVLQELINGASSPNSNFNLLTKQQIIALTLEAYRYAREKKDYHIHENLRLT